MKKILLLVASFIAVVVIFQLCYGLNTLEPTNISWLMTVRHDWGQHYLGWAFFKNEPWHFPLGNISGYYYPLGSNVGFTDSIPLLAIVFKVFAPLLPADFQYLGLWLFTCHLLTAYFTIRLFNLFKVNPIHTFLAVIFMVANPVLVYRGLHPALCGQCFLVACIYYYFLDPAVAGPRKILAYQLILLSISSLINPYICWMVLGFTLATSVRLWKYDKVINWKQLLGYLAASLLAILLLWYIAGLITFGRKENLGVEGAYGLYSLNLNSLYNAGGYSSLLPAFKQVSWHQYEGFMYLGVGIFLLLFIAIGRYIYMAARRRMGSAQPAGVNDAAPLTRINITPLLALAVLYALFAITHVYTLNDKVLFRLPAPSFITHIGDVFRASARFFWAPYYLIVLFTLLGITRLRIKPVDITVLLLGALCLQLYDTMPLLTSRKLTYGAYTPPLDNKSWSSLMNRFKEVVFFPPFESHQLVQMDYQDFCFLAMKAHKPINIGYVARSDARNMQLYYDSLTNKLESGHASPDALYVTTAPHLNHFALLLQSGSCRLNTLDGYYFIYSTALHDKSLQALSDTLNARSRSKLDSVERVVSQKVLFTETGSVPAAHDSAISYFVTRLNNSGKTISVDGWAFISGTNNNKGDSIFITLHGDNKSYIAPATILPRPDVTAHFNKSYLDDAGFRSISFTDNVEKGIYSVGLAIKNAKGEFIYQQAGQTVKIGMPEYSTPVKMAALPAEGKIVYGMDYVKKDDGMISVSGWAAFEEQGAEGCTISLLLKDKDNSYAAPMDVLLRPDVSTAFKNKYKLDSAGFRASVPMNLLPAGRYTVGIMIKDAVHHKENSVFLKEEIEVR